MVDFQTIEIAGIGSALCGMRHPLQSYNKSDSMYDSDTGDLIIGQQDYDLAKKLILAGDDSHCKFLRQIQVWVNITAPRFYWAEWDTYKIGTVANSQSTMHTLMKTGVDPKDVFIHWGLDSMVDEIMNKYVDDINYIIEIYHSTTDSETKHKYFETIKGMLPEGYFQTRMVSLNYQTLRTMYRQRKTHRLSGWSTDFAFWVQTLPLSQWITNNFEEVENNIELNEKEGLTE